MHKITKIFPTICAAHQLPTHQGQCRNLHGHNYKIEGSFTSLRGLSDSGSETGMVIDFSAINQLFKDHIHAVLDHSLILGTVPLPWYSRLVDLEEMISAFDVEHSPLTPSEAVTRVDSLLGKVVMLPMTVTTAENLAKWIHTKMSTLLRDAGHPHICVSQIRVWETDSAYAEY